jgi:hypothetical protein
LNADAACTSLPVIVGGNARIIAGKQMITNKWKLNYFGVKMFVRQNYGCMHIEDEEVED